MIALAKSLLSMSMFPLRKIAQSTCRYCGRSGFVGKGSKCPVCIPDAEHRAQDVELDTVLAALVAPRPRRIQRKRIKGWKTPANTVNVSRPSKWGNPFVVGKDVATPEEAVERYRAWFPAARVKSTGKLLSDHLQELHGQNVACYCSVDAVCHGDMLIELAAASRAASSNNVSIKNKSL